MERHETDGPAEEPPTAAAEGTIVHFDLWMHPQPYRVLVALAEATQATPTAVIQEALSAYWWMAKERSQGHDLWVRRGDTLTDLQIPSLQGMESLSPEALDALRDGDPPERPTPG